MVAKLPRGAWPYTAEPQHTLSNLQPLSVLSSLLTHTAHALNTSTYPLSLQPSITLSIQSRTFVCDSGASGRLCCIRVFVRLFVWVFSFSFFLFVFHFLLCSILPCYEIRRLISSYTHNLSVPIKKTLLDKLTQ